MLSTPKKIYMAILLLLPCLGWEPGYAKETTGPLYKIFPDGIINAKGEEIPLTVLNNKAIGIYFSAHWCGPCRRFTPRMVEYRDKYKDDFEVVFISSDRSEKDQFHYMKSAKMKWPTLKFKSKAGQELSKRFKVRGIPKLVVMNSKGEVLSENGRQMIMEI